jgi:7-cyano-7-deazaguanine reductase
MKMEPKYLGKPINQPIEELDSVPAPAGLDLVTMVSDEVTALGPVNRQPDYYTVKIEYVPDQKLIESKSLKLYLQHFRDQELYGESLAVVIRDEVLRTIEPRACRVTAVQKARGGITIEAVSSHRWPV